MDNEVTMVGTGQANKETGQTESPKVVKRKYVAPLRQQPRKKPRLIPTRSFFSRLVFFGTSSASPLPGVRNVSSLGIQLDSGDIFIVDCGEGTQCQLMRSTLKTSRIKAILFTHLHGDHCYGIFGLIKMLSHNGRKEPLWIVGPVGIKRMVLTVLYCSGGWNVDEGGRFRLVFHELPARNKQVIKLEETDDYLPGLTINCAPMRHLSMPTYGYVIHASKKQGKLDGKKARELGAEGKQLGMLKNGKDVTLESGVIIKSVDVLGIPTKPRGIAILLDTSDASSALELSQDIELLIHEATYDDTFREKAVAHGHSTGAMAAEFANRCGAKRLVLTHFSCRYRSCGTPGLPQVTDLQKEASKVAKCPVSVACDFKSFSGKTFEPDDTLALQHKELLVLQARKTYGQLDELQLNTGSKNLVTKEINGNESKNPNKNTKMTTPVSNNEENSRKDLQTVSTTTATIVSTDKFLTATSAEAGLNGEKRKLEP